LNLLDRTPFLALNSTFTALANEFQARSAGADEARRASLPDLAKKTSEAAALDPFLSVVASVVFP
jgi:hypothetical protein